MEGQIKNLSQRLGLTKSKIYKWNWDRKKKDLNMQAAGGDGELAGDAEQFDEEGNLIEI